MLSSIVLSSLNSARDKSKVAKAKSEVLTIYKAILSYNIDKNSWPYTDPGTHNIPSTADWNTAWKTGYINATISDDPLGTAYNI